jgi:hypothetical protein
VQGEFPTQRRQAMGSAGYAARQRQGARAAGTVFTSAAAMRAEERLQTTGFRASIIPHHCNPISGRTRARMAFSVGTGSERGMTKEDLGQKRAQTALRLNHCFKRILMRGRLHRRN